MNKVTILMRLVAKNHLYYRHKKHTVPPKLSQVKGLQVAPAELEDVLRGLDGVSDVAVSIDFKYILCLLHNFQSCHSFLEGRKGCLNKLAPHQHHHCQQS